MIGCENFSNKINAGNKWEITKKQAYDSDWRF